MRNEVTKEEIFGKILYLLEEIRDPSEYDMCLSVTGYTITLEIDGSKFEITMKEKK